MFVYILPKPYFFEHKQDQNFVQMRAEYKNSKSVTLLTYNTQKDRPRDAPASKKSDLML